MWVHGNSVLDIIYAETALLFSQEMIVWNLSFAFFGAIAAFFYGNVKQKTNALRNTEKKFRSVAESATDAIISINNRGKIVFWNTASQNIFGYTEDEIIGRLVTVLMPERYRVVHMEAMERLGSTGEARVIGKTVELHGMTKEGLEFPMELSLASWEIENETFYTSIIRDISARKRLEQEKEESILKLADALAKVKTLSGLLPICSYCKRIRDDKGYYHQIESYIRDHSEANFSHSICPNCAKEHFPDMNL
jgi:PAS domain S-box-containing protein